jgi:hypothetical protein
MWAPIVRDAQTGGRMNDQQIKIPLRDADHRSARHRTDARHGLVLSVAGANSLQATRNWHHVDFG